MTIKILTAPDALIPEEIAKYPIRLFLAGGISGCPDWQSEIIKIIQSIWNWECNPIKHKELLIFNPRNPNFNPQASQEEINAQVTWEWEALNNWTNIYLFWFPKETMCPITLYELGRVVANPYEPAIVIGCHPNYARLTTLTRQLQLDRPDVEIKANLTDLADSFLDIYIRY